MKLFCSSVVLGCLVTLTLPSPAVAQEDDGADTRMMNCEQEARAMGLQEPDEISAYVQECEDAAMPGDPSEDQEMDPQQDDDDADQSSGDME